MPNARPTKTEEDEPRLQISLVQVVAAALASITSAVILSKFGVAGTYVGTAIGSAVSTIAVAIYSHTMQQARRRVSTYAQRHHAGRVVDAPPVRLPPAAWNRSHPRNLPPVTVRASRRRRSGVRAQWDRLERWFAGLPLWGKAGLTAATAFVVAVAAVVLFQFVSGHSLSNVWGIGRSSNGPDWGCTIGRCGGPAPTATPQWLAPASGTTAPPLEPSLAPTPLSTPAATPLTTPVATPVPSLAPSPVPPPSP